VSVTECLSEIGGVASRATLVALTSRAAVDRALVSGDIVADARGRYALPVADEALRAASRLSGVASHLSAAIARGWEVKTPPKRPHVTLPKNRKLTLEQRQGVVLHRATLAAEDVDGFVTSRSRTLIDCLRWSPFDEALAVADSALRHGDVTPDQLVALARNARGPRSPAVRNVARAADGKAANPFESVLRALAMGVGLHVRPQVSIGGVAFLGRPDLVDVERRIVLEADSFAWHGNRKALRGDARRYNGFVVAGWLVLRFSWEDVMGDPDYVRGILEAAVRERTQVRCTCDCAACAACAA